MGKGWGCLSQERGLACYFHVSIQHRIQAQQIACTKSCSLHWLLPRLAGCLCVPWCRKKETLLEVGEVQGILANNILSTAIFMHSCSCIECRVRKDVFQVAIRTPALSSAPSNRASVLRVNRRQSQGLWNLHSSTQPTHLRTNT